MKGYFTRRIRRIWPPYYWAIAVTLALIVFVPGMNIPRDRYWDYAFPALETGSIISHLLFIQNLRSEWFFTINPPMWTVAVEEQIYLVFPLLLLPVWRRWGTFMMVVVAVLLGAATYYFIPWLSPDASLWYLGLFVLGAAGASINFSRHPFEILLCKRVPWSRLGTVVLVSWMVIKGLSELGYTDLTVIAR